MNSKQPPDRDKTHSHDEKVQDMPAGELPGALPSGERRGRHRVADDQQSGSGSQSALSKLMMLERKRAAMLPPKG